MRRKNEAINKRTAGIIWKCKKPAIFVKKKLKINMWKIKKYRKVRHHCLYTGEYIGTAYSICSLKPSVPREIFIVYHKRFNYYYNFIVKELAEECEKNFTCLGGNAEKYKTFTVTIEEQVIRTDKMENKSQKPYIAVYNLLTAQVFLPRSVSNLVNNLAEKIHKVKYKSLCCNKNYQIKFDKYWKNSF